MSKEAATAFISKARSDSEIQQKLAGIGQNATAADLLDVAATFGYKFSEQDLALAVRDEIESQGVPGNELSEADLEQVAGGNTPISNIVTRELTRSIMK